MVNILKLVIFAYVKTDDCTVNFKLSFLKHVRSCGKPFI